MGRLLFLLFHELLHTLVAAGLAALLRWRARSCQAAVLCFSVSLLVDLDHLLDYLLLTQFRRFDLLEFLQAPQYQAGHAFSLLVFHGYEWVIGLALLAWRCRRWRWLAAGAALGLLAHLLIDQLSYGGHPLRYFFLFRLLSGFRFNAFAGIP
ncbi:MAG: hypothetical protein HYY96_13840 [Candidatus Tectomicrobia bacterium]|nr:hypothetical protein [Candidatus Tectomicrobia bacterium]